MAKHLADTLNADVEDVRKFEKQYRVGLFSFNKLKTLVFIFQFFYKRHYFLLKVENWTRKVLKIGLQLIMLEDNRIIQKKILGSIMSLSAECLTCLILIMMVKCRLKSKKYYKFLNISKHYIFFSIRFIAGNIMLTSRDRNESLRAIFKILDIDTDGFVTEKEIVKIFACMGWFSDADFEASGAKQAEELMRKLDSNQVGKVSKDAFVEALINDPDCASFCNRFNINEASVIPGNYYTQEPGVFLKNKKN